MGSSRDGPPPAKRQRVTNEGDTEAEGPKLSACDVVRLHRVQSGKDLSQRNESDEFRPKYLHQVFPKESITGYSSADIAVHFDPMTLATYITEDLEKHSDSEPKLPSATLARFIRDGLCPTKEDFVKGLSVRDDHIAPVSTMVAKYSIGKREYGVYRGEPHDDSELRSYHRRIEFFMLLHIDNGSFIDLDDSRWICYYVFELGKGDTPREFVAYLSTYPFSAMTPGCIDSFRERLRISQVLVMPQFQGKGHGSRLLRCVYQAAEKRNVLEVTVEDPSLGFRILRDLVDLRRAYTTRLLEYEQPVPIDDVDSVVEKLQGALRITKTQARRVFEVHSLGNIDQNDEDELKKFRLFVKRRLYVEYVEVLGSLDIKDRKLRLGELYDETAQEYQVVVDRLRSRGVALPDVKLVDL